MAGPTKSVNMGFVNLNGVDKPEDGQTYDLVSVASSVVGGVAIPQSNQFYRMNIILNKLYIEDLPDFTKKNEALLQLQTSTRSKEDIEGVKRDVTFSTEFEVRDGDYSPTFLYRGVFRNVLFREWINLKFDLYEIDEDASVYFDKIKNVINDVPEIKDIDALKSIPYLNVATELFEGVIKTFGKNPDDHEWGEIPQLELYPGPGGAFLRRGIYVVFQEKNKARDEIVVDNIKYKDFKVNYVSNNNIKMSNHLIFSIDIRPYVQ